MSVPNKADSVDRAPNTGLQDRLSEDVVIQREASGECPSDAEFQRWVGSALAAVGHAPGELTIRVVNSEESRVLNNTYRGKDKPTNVLSFAYDMPGLLGDLAICAPVVQQEAEAQGKTEAAHWCHMTVHGCLHLCGYDHVEPDDAVKMEALEAQILNQLQFPNPYTG